MEKLFLIEESLLRAMTDAFHKIIALEEAGIDDLEGDSNAYQDYLASWDCEHMTWDEFVEHSVENDTEVIPVDKEQTVYILKNYSYKGEL